MEKALKIITSALIIAGIVTVCGTETSCKSSEGEVLYKTKHESTKTIRKNYRVKGTNERNKQTYRSY